MSDAHVVRLATAHDTIGNIALLDYPVVGDYVRADGKRWVVTGRIWDSKGLTLLVRER